MKTFILTLITAFGLIIAAWGPFNDCGITNPSGLNDCDKYSTKTGLGCCFLELQDSSKTKSCILVGGRAQGYLNNATRIAPISFSNFNITPEVYNKTLNETIKFNKELAQNYTEVPSGIVKCMKTDSSSFLNLSAYFLVLAALIIL